MDSIEVQLLVHRDLILIDPGMTNLIEGMVNTCPPRRQPFSPEEAYNRPFVPRHFEDPYFYDDHGMKWPFYMMDQDPDYMEPSRFRPRLDYSDPAGPFHGDRYRDSYKADCGFYSREDDYYARDFGAYPPYYGGDRPYGGGYYY